MHRAYLYVPFARCMSIRVADHARIIIELRWSDRLQGKRPERPCGPGEAKRGCAQATYEYSLECLLVHLYACERRRSRRRRLRTYVRAATYIRPIEGLHQFVRFSFS
jgi:hypothetical protein